MQFDFRVGAYVPVTIVSEMVGEHGRLVPPSLYHSDISDSPNLTSTLPPHLLSYVILVLTCPLKVWLQVGYGTALSMRHG